MAAGLPAFSFQGDELAIKTAAKSYRIRGWPDPCAREQQPGGAWKEIRPEFCLVKPEPGGLSSLDDQDNPVSLDDGSTAPGPPPDILAAKREAFGAFRSRFPQRVARAVERFQSHQWNLIDLLSKEEAAQDLADNNPVLAWCLANCDQFRRLYGTLAPAGHARSHVAKKQIEILRWLDFPATDSMVRLMRKVLPDAITPMGARMLRKSIVEPEAAKLLVHQRSINAGAIGLACNFRLLSSVSPQLLAEIAGADEERTRQPTADLLIDTLYLTAMAQIHVRLPRFTSVQGVRDFHERMAAECQRKSEEERRHAAEKAKRKAAVLSRSFPRPPVIGTEDIVPMTSAAQLKAEGLEQQNCVASYAQKVRAGDTYINRVLSPERATLSITLGPDGFWRRAEIELSENRAASPETKAAVDRWLSLHSLSV